MTYVPDTPENAQRCNCPGCPSNPTPLAELFCGREHAEAVEERGCLCMQCPVYRVYNLSGDYYCRETVA